MKALLSVWRGSHGKPPRRPAGATPSPTPQLGPFRAEDTPRVAGPSLRAPSGPRLRLGRLSLATGRPAPAAQHITQPPGNDCHYVIAVSLGPVICHC